LGIESSGDTVASTAVLQVEINSLASAAKETSLDTLGSSIGNRFEGNILRNKKAGFVIELGDPHDYVVQVR
jgi:hypothetical protein